MKSERPEAYRGKYSYKKLDTVLSFHNNSSLSPSYIKGDLEQSNACTDIKLERPHIELQNLTENHTNRLMFKYFICLPGETP